MGDSGSSGGEHVIIARARRSPLRVLLLLAVVGPACAYLIISPSWSALVAVTLLLTGAAMVDQRVGAMKLAVGEGSVEVVNFLSSHFFDLDTVRVITEEEESHWPVDDIPTSMNKPSDDVPKIGSLHLSDEFGRRVRVGVVPSYGARAREITDDLNVAIAKHRLA